MTRLESILRMLEEEFDAFIILGSMYSPADGETRDTRVQRGNKHIITDMIRDEAESIEWAFTEEEDEEDG